MALSNNPRTNLRAAALLSNTCKPLSNLDQPMNWCSLHKMLRCAKSNFTSEEANTSSPDTLKWGKFLCVKASLINSASAFELTITAVVSWEYCTCKRCTLSATSAYSDSTCSLDINCSSLPCRGGSKSVVGNKAGSMSNIFSAKVLNTWSRYRGERWFTNNRWRCPSHRCFSASRVLIFAPMKEKIACCSSPRYITVWKSLLVKPSTSANCSGLRSCTSSTCIQR